MLVLDWHIAPFRADRWLDAWEPAAARMHRLRRQELVADPLDRRPARLPADVGLGAARRLRTLLVLPGDRRGRGLAHRLLRPSDPPHLAHGDLSRIGRPGPLRPATDVSSGGRHGAKSRRCCPFPSRTGQSTGDGERFAPEENPGTENTPIGGVGRRHRALPPGGGAQPGGARGPQWNSFDPRSGVGARSAEPDLQDAGSARRRSRRRRRAADQPGRGDVRRPGTAEARGHPPERPSGFENVLVLRFCPHRWTFEPPPAD